MHGSVSSAVLALPDIRDWTGDGVLPIARARLGPLGAVLWLDPSAFEVTSDPTGLDIELGLDLVDQLETEDLLVSAGSDWRCHSDVSRAWEPCGFSVSNAGPDGMVVATVGVQRLDGPLEWDGPDNRELFSCRLLFSVVIVPRAAIPYV